MSTTAATSPGEQLTVDLDRALLLGQGRLAATDHAALSQLRERVVERLAIGDGLTVAALAGGTGVGKSALLNALVGTEVAVVGVRRPTTGHALAVTGAMDAPTTALLDWLAIDDRRSVAGALADGLVLVDLPDHDSLVEHHRATSERLAGRVDALVVVVDPLKYARADLHEGPLAALRQHAEVLLVALNRSDELSGSALAAVRVDLLERLRADGLDGARIVATSATTGQGVEELRAQLQELARSRRAVLRRLTADAAVTARTAAAALPDLPSAPVDAAGVVDAVLDAADGHRGVVAHTVAWRHAARTALRSPLARLVRTPLIVARRAGRELGLSAVQSGERPDPAPVRSQEAIARVLADELALADTTGLAYQALDRAVRDAAVHAAPKAVAAVRSTRQQRPGRRWWWPMFAALRGIAEAAAITGLVWSVLLGVGDWLGLPAVPTPQVTEEFTWPAALLLGGLTARLLLGLLSRWARRVGARRVARAAERDLRRQLTAVVEEHLVAPYEQEVTAYRELHAVLARLTAVPPRGR